MSKGFKLAALAGAMSMALSGAASAAADVPNFIYDGWTVSGGNINENAAGSMCASSLYSCSVVASGAGFKQINVTEVADASSGTSYIMTIVTDQDAGAAGGTGAADLGFSDVSFVRMNLTLGGVSGNGESGITARQNISETGTGKAFSSITDINTGWAGGNGANIVIEQTLSDVGKDVDANGNAAPGFAGDDFSAGFIYRSKNDPATGKSVGFEMSIDQVAGLAQSAGGADANDIQVFALREKKGVYVTADSSASSRNPNGIDLNLADANNPVITWAGDTTASGGTPGDDIKAIWIGQQINLGSTPDTGSLSLGSSFGYVSFENVTTQQADSAFGFSATNSGSAWEWDDAFYINETADPALPAP